MRRAIIFTAGCVGACLAFTAPAPAAGLRRAGAVAVCAASADAAAPSRRGFLTLAAGLATAARTGMQAAARAVRAWHARALAPPHALPELQAVVWGRPRTMRASRMERSSSRALTRRLASLQARQQEW